MRIHWIIVVLLSLCCTCFVLPMPTALSGPCTKSMSKPLGRLPHDVYVINMKKDTKRMISFTKEYLKTDLAKRHSLIRHDAVVGKDVSLAEVVDTKALYEILRAERLGYRQKHYELTRGAIGAWLSHVGLWKKVLESDKDYALVFEDDCIMARNIGAVMNSINVPRDADVVLLGYFCNSCRPNEGCTDVLSVHKFFGLHAYFITRKGIGKMLKNPKMQLINKQIDAVMSDMLRDEELTIYALPRAAAWQDSRHQTTIQMQLMKVQGVDEWADA